MELKFPGNMHINTLCANSLQFRKILCSSSRGVALNITTCTCTLNKWPKVRVKFPSKNGTGLYPGIRHKYMYIHFFPNSLWHFRKLCAGV